MGQLPLATSLCARSIYLSHFLSVFLVFSTTPLPSTELISWAISHSISILVCSFCASLRGIDVKFWVDPGFVYVCVDYISDTTHKQTL